MTLKELLTTLEELKELLGEDTQVFLSDYNGYPQRLTTDMVDTEALVEMDQRCDPDNEGDMAILIAEQYD